jgi:hypothetical protein
MEMNNQLQALATLTMEKAYPVLTESQLHFRICLGGVSKSKCLLALLGIKPWVLGRPTRIVNRYVDWGIRVPGVKWKLIPYEYDCTFWYDLYHGLFFCSEMMNWRFARNGS